MNGYDNPRGSTWVALKNIFYKSLLKWQLSWILLATNFIVYLYYAEALSNQPHYNKWFFSTIKIILFCLTERYASIKWPNVEWKSFLVPIAYCFYIFCDSRLLFLLGSSAPTGFRLFLASFIVINLLRLAKTVYFALLVMFDWKGVIYYQRME